MVLEDQPCRPGDGFERIATALREKLPTTRHAQMLLQAVQAQLGARAWLEVQAKGLHNRLFASESEEPASLVPWPILHLALGAASSSSQPTLPILGGLESWQIPEPPPRPPVPNLRGLTFGDLTIFEGHGSFEIRYAEDGGSFECCTSGQRVLHALRDACEGKVGNPVELIADRVAAFRGELAGPARLHLPVPLPCGAEGAWSTAMLALRRALWERREPADARFAAVDCLGGEQMTFGASRDEAWAAMRAAIAQRQPRRPRPKPLPPGLGSADDDGPGLDASGEDSGIIHLRAPRPDMPWPEPTPESTPIAFVPIPPPPARACPFGRWQPLIDGFGNITYAALQHEAEGFTLIDGALLDDIDLAGLDALLVEPEAEQEARWRRLREQARDDGRPLDYSVASFAFRDAQGKLIPPEPSGGFLSPEPNPLDALDGARVRGTVVRQRWLL